MARIFFFTNVSVLCRASLPPISSAKETPTIVDFTDAFNAEACEVGGQYVSIRVAPQSCPGTGHSPFSFTNLSINSMLSMLVRRSPSCYNPRKRLSARIRNITMTAACRICRMLWSVLICVPIPCFASDVELKPGQTQEGIVRAGMRKSFVVLLNAQD